MNDFVIFLEGLDRSNETIKGYTSDLKQFSRWFKQTNGEELSPTNLTSTDLREYRQWLLIVKKAAPATINRHLNAVKVYARFINLKLEVRGVREQQRSPLWLNKKQLSAVMRELDIQTSYRGYVGQRNINVVELLINTGLRVGELCKLQPGDVDLSERKGSLTVRAGKGNKTRVIPLNKIARQCLINLGELPIKISPRTLQKELAGVTFRTGVEVTPHRLRHTFAKNLIDSGVSLEKVAALMGHESLETTRLYTVPGQQDLARAVEVLEV
jgi:integrase/recombinase XerC